MFYTYILKSQKNNRLYVGSTDNLKRRFSEHNKGIGGTYTSKNRPFTLIYYEAYQLYSNAKASERFYKTGYGREVLKGKLKEFLLLK
jgi:putative endonuclease